MVSDRYARQQFGDPADAPGRTLRLGNRVRAHRRRAATGLRLSRRHRHLVPSVEPAARSLTDAAITFAPLPD